MRLVKYGGMSHLAFEIGRLCLPGIPEDYFDGIDYLIAVPLHRMRLRQRGYNQAWWFAKGVIDRREMQGAVLLENVLVRRRNTRTQTKLDKEARKKNLEGAFEVMESGAGLVKDKAIVLVDDVITTGATMAACANELLKAGCKSVKVLSLARD
jgi:ComF family protein